MTESVLPCIAFVAPELPALSATFVYEELLAVERRGIRVMPFSVHAPGKAVASQRALADRTCILYGATAPVLALRGLLALPTFGLGMLRGLKWLAADMLALRPWRLAAWKLLYQFFAGVELARRVREAGCVHIHVHFAHVPTQIAMVASALTGVPFTVMAHANDIFERGQLLPQKARRALKFLTISEHNVRHLRSVGVPSEQLAVVRCGVSFVPRSDTVSFEDKARYRIGTLGRLVEKKGVDDLLRAVALLAKAGVAVDLDIAGDGPLREQLEALARELGVLDQVTFIGSLDHTAVAAWLRSLDVFALACKADANGDMDGIPVVLMEAMSQRVPVVSTRLSGIPELVVHRETGLLGEPADPQGLADALQLLLRDHDLRQRLADAAARHVEAEFGQSVNVDRLIRHMSKAVGSALPSASITSSTKS